jgi:hypothetical protein
VGLRRWRLSSGVRSNVSFIVKLVNSDVTNQDTYTRSHPTPASGLLHRLQSVEHAHQVDRSVGGIGQRSGESGDVDMDRIPRQFEHSFIAGHR